MRVNGILLVSLFCDVCRVVSRSWLPVVTADNTFDKTKFSCFILPPTQHHSFFINSKQASCQASTPSTPLARSYTSHGGRPYTKLPLVW